MRDLTGFSLLAHTAVREAEVAVHAVLGKKDCMSYRAIPGVVYTNPEIAGVGIRKKPYRKRVFLSYGKAAYGLFRSFCRGE